MEKNVGDDVNIVELFFPHGNVDGLHDKRQKCLCGENVDHCAPCPSSGTRNIFPIFLSDHFTYLCLEIFFMRKKCFESGAITLHQFIQHRGCNGIVTQSRQETLPKRVPEQILNFFCKRGKQPPPFLEFLNFCMFPIRMFVSPQLVEQECVVGRKERSP